jgi:two-component system, OmpR family, sensor histidine kinase KdpD
MSERLKILLIEDSPEDARLILELLRESRSDFELVHCRRLGDGLDAISRDGIQVVLLDLNLPDSMGMATFDSLRERAPDLPLIVLTTVGDDRIALQAMQHGAQDYLIKGRTDPELLGRSIRYARERKKAELELRHSEAKYRRLVENLNEGILSINEAGLITFANPRTAEILAHPMEGLIGRNVTDFIDRAHAHLAVQYLICQQTGMQEMFELDLRRNDGTRVHTLMATSPIVDAAGNLLGCLAGMVDITDRKRAEQEVQSRNEQLMVLNQVISVSASSLSLAELLEESLAKTLDLMEFDVGLVYMLDTERKRALLQYQQGAPSSYVARSRVIKVHHWPFNFVFIAGQSRYIERGSSLSSIEESILAELEASSLACIPLTAESVVVGAVYVGSRTQEAFSSQEKTLLEAIGKEIGSGILKGMLHKRLEAAHREANLYLDIMTHDIKNAENVSSLYSDLLIEMLNGEAGLYARNLRNSIRKSVEIIENVSTIRRIHQEATEVRPVDLDSVIRGEIEVFPDVSIDYESTPRQVWADDMLREIFTNLIGNAIKFGKAGVKVVIRVEDYDGENMLVTVEDTGPGIPDPMKEAIFHRFVRGRNQPSGEGLGLYIVRTLVERYGGTIRVEDRVEGRPDLGAAFKFTLREVLSTYDDDAEEYLVEEESE